MREWENKAAVDKTCTNIKTFISVEYARKNKQNKLTAKQFKANTMEEQVEATEELIAALTENHTRQMEMLIRSTTDATKEMMQLIKNQATTQTNPTKVSNKEKKKAQWEAKDVLQSTGLHSLWQKASIKERGGLLGTREQQSILPSQLEIVEKHLKVHGVLNRSRDAAARTSDIE